MMKNVLIPENKSLQRSVLGVGLLKLSAESVISPLAEEEDFTFMRTSAFP